MSYAATPSNVINASLRFVRSNPEALSYARANARRLGIPVDELLMQAVRRMRAQATGARESTHTIFSSVSVGSDWSGPVSPVTRNPHAS